MSRISKIREHLAEHGPTSATELPTDFFTHKDRKRVNKFDMNFTSVGGSRTRVGKTTPVYHFRDEHDPKNVIRLWVSINDVLDEISPRAFLQVVNRHGSRFSDVSTEVAKELYSEAEWSNTFSNGGNNGGEGTTLSSTLENMDPDDLPVGT